MTDAELNRIIFRYVHNVNLMILLAIFGLFHCLYLLTARSSSTLWQVLLNNSHIFPAPPRQIINSLQLLVCSGFQNYCLISQLSTRHNLNIQFSIRYWKVPYAFSHDTNHNVLPHFLTFSNLFYTGCPLFEELKTEQHTMIAVASVILWHAHNDLLIKTATSCNLCS